MGIQKSIIVEVLLHALGVIEGLINKSISIDVGYYSMLRPVLVSLLEKNNINREENSELFDLIEDDLLVLEDISSLSPKSYEDEMERIKRTILHMLSELTVNIDSDYNSNNENKESLWSLILYGLAKKAGILNKNEQEEKIIMGSVGIFSLSDRA